MDVHDSTPFYGNRSEDLGHRCPPNGWLHQGFMGATAENTHREDKFIVFSDAKTYWYSDLEDATL